MAELISLESIPRELKIMLLKELEFGTDGIYVLDKTGQPHKDRYTNEPVRIDNMAILPGSTIILDNNELSISSYFEEFGDVI